MNNIYVDEVPDSCFYCDFFIRENYCCYLIQKDAREYRDDCPLIPITDRLAEERKRVVQEIREKALKREIFYTGDKSKSEWKNEYCIFDFELEKIEGNGK